MQRVNGWQSSATKLGKNFLGKFSIHRTPLNAILGMISILHDSKLSPSENEYVKVISDSSKSLLELLNTILDFSKIEQNKLSLEVSHPNSNKPQFLKEREFNIHTCMNKASTMCKHLSGNRNLSIQMNIAPNLPKWVVGDKVSIILDELFTNTECISIFIIIFRIITLEYRIIHIVEITIR